MLNFKKFILENNRSIESCIKKLDKNLNSNLPKIIIIVDKSKKVLGTVTDGDIRRGLINKIDIKNKVIYIMNSQPKLIRKESLGSVGTLVNCK